LIISNLLNLVTSESNPDSRRSPALFRFIEYDAEDATTHNRRHSVEQTPAPLLLALAVAFVWTFVAALTGGMYVTVAGGERVGLSPFGITFALAGVVALGLLPPVRGRERLQWLAVALAVWAMGTLAAVYILPFLGHDQTLDARAYAWIMVRIALAVVAGLAFVPAHPIRLNLVSVAVVGCAMALCALLLLSVAQKFPPLVGGVTIRHGLHSVTHLTKAGNIITGLAIILTAAGFVRSLRLAKLSIVGYWVPAALLLFTFSTMQALVWPSPYGTIPSSASLLNACALLSVVVGALWELYRVILLRTRALESREHELALQQELSRMKTSFTLQVAHELGNPLAAIRASTEVLRADVVDAETRKQMIDFIHSETFLLVALASDISAAAQAERSDFLLNPRPVPLHDIVLQAVHFARALPGDHPISAPFLVTGLVWADPERIAQVLRNLIGNAAKYSPYGTPIAIRATKTNNRWLLEVEDRGQGIHPDDQDRIFKEYARGRHQDGDKVHGVGLGLYIARRIVRAHGSDLTVRSELGVGSTFAFELDEVI
jgi:signal transduction histidine kinase